MITLISIISYLVLGFLFTIVIEGVIYLRNSIPGIVPESSSSQFIPRLFYILAWPALLLMYLFWGENIFRKHIH